MCVRDKERPLAGNCPFCAASVISAGDMKRSVILMCSECLTPLLVEGIEDRKMVLTRMPDSEEEWEELEDQ